MRSGAEIRCSYVKIQSGVSVCIEDSRLTAERDPVLDV